MESTPRTAYATAFVSAAVVFVLRIYAETVFLAEFGSVYLPHFFTVHALTLILASALYGACIRRGGTVVFDSLMLLLLAGAAFASPLSVRAGGVWLFAGTVTLLTVSTLTLFASWNALTAVVSGRTERTFIPRAGAAATAGAMVGAFGALSIVATKGVGALAPVAAALALVALGLRLALSEAAPVDKRGAKNKDRRSTDTAVSRKLVAFLAVAAVVESMFSVLVDFGFKQAIESSYRDRSAAMGIAFALYYGCTNSLLLIVQWFGATRLLSHRSLSTILSVQPITILVIAMLWLMFPILLLATLARGLDQVLRFGVARPGQEVALMPLSLSARKRWRVLLRGVYTQFGAALAGLAMIPAGTWLSRHPSVIPAAAGLLALLLVIVNRRVVALYLEALGNALGSRRLVLADGRDAPFLDRNGLGRLVEMTGGPDPQRARFAGELLESLAPDSVALATHLPGQPVQIREVLYRQLARCSSADALTPLRRSVEAEPDSGGALAAGLLSLAAQGDKSAVERARALTESESAGPDSSPGTPAWTYLAWVGALDGSEQHKAVILAMIPRDGLTAAAVCAAALERKSLDAKEVDDAVASAMHSDNRESRLEAMRAAARLGRPVPLTRLLQAMEQHPDDAAVALRSLGDGGFDQLRQLTKGGAFEPRTRARILLGLRGNASPSAADLAADWLLDDDGIVRERAVHTLLKHMREGVPVLQSSLKKALERQVDRVSVYVRARTTGSMPREFRSGALFPVELERVTARSLSRLCGLLALFGNPATVHLAERGLRSPSPQRRREAVDVLQEVVRGATRRRLITLLEHYLAPPASAPTDARSEASRIDPWLATCVRLGDAPIAKRLWALRATTLFDSIPGHALHLLAEQAQELSFDDGETIVAGGAAPKGLCVVVDGRCRVVGETGAGRQLGPGDTFGELGLVNSQPDPLSLKGADTGSLLMISQELFERVMNEHPEIGFDLLRDLVRRLREETDGASPSVARPSGLRARSKEAAM